MLTKTMTNTLLISSLFAGLILLLSSCKTYYIPVDSFKQQFANMDTSNMREVTTQGPAGDPVKYKIYPIDYIHAVDKTGNPITIPNSPSIEIRFTDTSNRKTIFYFDLIRFDGENITGRQSRFMSAFKKTIPINSVKKIEVQDGKKNFRYLK